jgi:hypothetical protein
MNEERFGIVEAVIGCLMAVFGIAVGLAILVVTIIVVWWLLTPIF